MKLTFIELYNKPVWTVVISIILQHDEEKQNDRVFMQNNFRILNKIIIQEQQQCQCVMSD